MKKSLCMIFMMLTLFLSFSFVVSAQNDDVYNDFGLYLYQDTLPVYYEKWYPLTYGGIEYKNYRYQDFRFINGYASAETVTRILLSPLMYQFYSRADAVTVTYSFY